MGLMKLWNETSLRFPTNNLYKVQTRALNRRISPEKVAQIMRCNKETFPNEIHLWFRQHYHETYNLLTLVTLMTIKRIQVLYAGGGSGKANMGQTCSSLISERESLFRYEVESKRRGCNARKSHNWPMGGVISITWH